jgi:hypothetical protein
MDEFFEQDIEEGEEGEEDNMKAELKAFERASTTNPLLELVSTSTRIDDKQRGKPNAPTDRFYINAYKVISTINDNSSLKISNNDMTVMAEKSLVIHDLEYKNPAGYVLGFLASSGGRKMSEKNINFVIEELLPIVGKDYGITPPDVIRYARYWTLVL